MSELGSRDLLIDWKACMKAVLNVSVEDSSLVLHLVDLITEVSEERGVCRQI